MNRKPIKRAALIHDLCGVGKAALTNMLPVLAVMGVEACPVPTYVLSTHTGGFGKPAMEKLPNFPKECAVHYKEAGIRFDSIIIGYLGNSKAAVSARYFAGQYPEAYLILDPVFADKGKRYANFDENYEACIRNLIPLSQVITPNFTEACLLAGLPCKDSCSNQELGRIWQRLSVLGAQNMVITSVPGTRPDTIGIFFANEAQQKRLEWPMLEKSFPGTGDLFAAVLAGSLLKGKNLEESLYLAHDFVNYCMEVSSRHDYPAREGILLEPCLWRLLETE